MDNIYQTFILNTWYALGRSEDFQTGKAGGVMSFASGLL